MFSASSVLKKTPLALQVLQQQPLHIVAQFRHLKR